MENTREIVLDGLLQLEREGGFSNQLIAAILEKYDYLDQRDKAFMKRLFEGTLERRMELDEHLDRVSSVPVRKMKPLIRCLMRMSAYQILYMDSVPDSAVVNEAVKLAAKRKFQNLKGFVNGVLRSLIREKDKADSETEGTAKKTDDLSVKYSVPDWIVSMWTEQYGREKTETILAALLEIHPVSLRFRTDRDNGTSRRLQMEAQGVVLKQSPLLSYVYSAEHVGGVANLPGFAEGDFTVQDVSSCMAVEAADIKVGDFVVDACAAPGGKSLLAAEKTGKNGHVISRDLTEKKVQKIRDNAKRLSLENVTAEVWDACICDENLLGRADVCLLDVPCSGLGIIGKKRDIKYNVTPNGMKEIIALQRKILDSSCGYVKQGGVLLYSTCTIHSEENEKQVEYLCSKGFACEEMRQLLPGTDGCDGFFYARLRRL